MSKQILFFTTLLASISFLLAACSSPTPTVSPTLVAKQANSTGKAASAFATKNNSGGSVDVAVTPLAISASEPVVFDIVMNTHSVDLSDDMTQIVILRDDTGKEYKPTGWEGGEPGGHHREGNLKFAALSGKPKYIELVIVGLAKVPERVFRWDLS
ncbi:MAG: hypothetical protein HZB51_01955 [Chloroflexi bacterium]|nr:hypothetical protein [Chloroflexota bacterium]